MGMAHIELYYTEYDDTDRYFDFIYDVYMGINKFITVNFYTVLDNNNFIDFFEFMLHHINHQLVDDLIISCHLEKLKHESGHNFIDFCSSTSDDLIISGHLEKFRYESGHDFIDFCSSSSDDYIIHDELI